MASSLKELIEEWEARADSFWRYERSKYVDIQQCIEDLRDTLLVMEAEEVRRGAVPK